MGQTGPLAPCGQLRCGNGRAAAEKVYDSLVAQLTDPTTGRSPMDLSQGTYQEGRVYALAIQIGAALTCADRAYNQGDPTKAIAGLPNLEKDYEATPAPTDTFATRRARLSALKKGHKGGATTWSVVDALRTLLGAKFYAYFPTRTVATATFIPANPGASSQIHASPVETPAKFVKLTAPSAVGSTLPLPLLEYTNVDPTAEEVVLEVGDIVMVQPDNTVVAEQVTVLFVGGVAGARTFSAHMTFAHDAGAIVTTMNWPNQTSSGRQNFVVVDPSIAALLTTRRLIDDLMPHVLRGVSTWSVVAGSFGSIPAFTLNTSLIGSAPLSLLSYTPSP